MNYSISSPSSRVKSKNTRRESPTVLMSRPWLGTSRQYWKIGCKLLTHTLRSWNRISIESRPSSPSRSRTLRPSMKNAIHSSSIEPFSSKDNKFLVRTSSNSNKTIVYNQEDIPIWSRSGFQDVWGLEERWKFSKVQPGCWRHQKRRWGKVQENRFQSHQGKRLDKHGWHRSFIAVRQRANPRCERRTSSIHIKNQPVLKSVFVIIYPGAG